ncbi:hypothetical protein L1D16_12615 [Vibrio sp. Isolate31]|uniref:hypothetical protein n=1 Tax=unclassified Vibrio TaxID=2614977 RepID=UPI001EFE5042|nr:MULTISPECIES: hypothetical protein [unclassified Vibrio]MCG9554295.1 hypothetical protein [Vibrio sp. Isolate32]MCG9601703.1 hypothetical protein [Vibrio sp. Isolate31]
MKRYPSKSIVTFLILTLSVLVLFVAVVLQIRGDKACDDCYESDKGPLNMSSTMEHHPLSFPVFITPCCSTEFR